MTNKTWCPLPWMSLNLRNTGDVRICCQANASQGQGLVKDENGKGYNLSSAGIHDHRNAPLMKEVRLAMLKGEWHDSCIRCKRETESGMFSRRDSEAAIWKNHITEESARHKTREDGSIDIEDNPILYMDLRFGNLCNLKCRMCGPTDSNQWYDDQVAVWGVESYNDGGYKVRLEKDQKGRYQPVNDIYSWHENPKFWNEMEGEIGNIRRLYLVGGEPLLIDAHYEFLNKCIEKGTAGNIVLEYNTNITNIPQRAWDIWKHFEKVQIGFSVDGIGKVNEYIRYPSKWSQIEKNMHRLDQADGNFKVWWAATVQVYNMIHLPEMMLWRLDQGFRRLNDIDHDDRPIMTFHPLHNPKFLNVKIFPEKSKRFIVDMFEQRKKESRDRIRENLDYGNEHYRNTYYTWYCKYLDQYSKYMMSEDYSDQIGKFWQYTNKLDDIRNQSLRDMDPQLYDLLKI